jgi:hypothetical protein
MFQKATAASVALLVCRLGSLSEIAELPRWPELHDTVRTNVSVSTQTHSAFISRSHEHFGVAGANLYSFDTTFVILWE